jgi:hypothetical protein
MRGLVRGGRIGAALAALVAGCTPIVGQNLGGGDYAVTTRVRLQGLDEAAEQNAWAARQQCPDGFLVLDDETGRDAGGVFRRWRYGCLEPPPR